MLTSEARKYAQNFSR